MICHKDQAILQCQAAVGYSKMENQWQNSNVFSFNTFGEEKNDDDDVAGNLNLPEKYYIQNQDLFIWPVYNAANQTELLKWYCLDYCPTSVQILTQL